MSTRMAFRSVNAQRRNAKFTGRRQSLRSLAEMTCCLPCTMADDCSSATAARSDTVDQASNLRIICKTLSIKFTTFHVGDVTSLPNRYGKMSKNHKIAEVLRRWYIIEFHKVNPNCDLRIERFAVMAQWSCTVRLPSGGPRRVACTRDQVFGAPCRLMVWRTGRGAAAG